MPPILPSLGQLRQTRTYQQSSPDQRLGMESRLNADMQSQAVPPVQPPTPGPAETAIPQQHSLLPQAPQPARQPPIIDTSFGLPSERAYQQAEEAQRQQQARPAALLPRNPAEVSAETAQPERNWLDYPKDIGVGALKTSIGFTQGLQGLANIPTIGKFGQFTEKLGYKPAEAQAILDTMYSPAQQYASRQVNEAKGFIPTIQKSLEYPSTIVQAVGESSASMLGGMGAGRLVLSKAPTLVTALSGRLGMAAETVAGAIGEGAISAGALAEGIREQTEKGDLSLGQSALALAGGIGTGVLSLVGGKISDSGGFADIDSLFIGSGAMKKPVKAAKAIVAGGITEGLEEMPQEIQEQVVENAALGRPLMQGVPESAAQALLAGAAMGSGANIIAGVAGQDSGVDDQGETTTAATQPASQPPVTDTGTASEMVETVINGINTGQLNPDDPAQAEVINTVREQMRAVTESPSPEVQEVVAQNRDILERIGALEPEPTGATGEQQAGTDQATQFEAGEPQFPEEVALARAQAIQPKDRTKEEAELVKNYQERVEAEELALRRARAIDEQYRTPEEQEIVRSAEQREQEGYAKEELKAGQTAQATEEAGAQPGKGKLPPVESLAGVVDFKNTSLDELQGIVKKVQETPFERLSDQEKRVAEAIAQGGQAQGGQAQGGQAQGGQAQGGQAQGGQGKAAEGAQPGDTEKGAPYLGWGEYPDDAGTGGKSGDGSRAEASPADDEYQVNNVREVSIGETVITPEGEYKVTGKPFGRITVETGETFNVKDIKKKISLADWQKQAIKEINEDHFDAKKIIHNKRLNYKDHDYELRALETRTAKKIKAVLGGVKPETQRKEEGSQPDDAGRGGKGGDESRTEASPAGKPGKGRKELLEPITEKEGTPQLDTEERTRYLGEKEGRTARTESKRKQIYKAKEFQEARRDPKKHTQITEQRNYKGTLPANTERLMNITAERYRAFNDAQASVDENKEHLVRLFDKAGTDSITVSVGGQKFTVKKPLPGKEQVIMNLAGRDALDALKQKYKDAGLLTFDYDQGVTLMVQPAVAGKSKAAAYGPKSLEAAAREHVRFMKDLAEARFAKDAARRRITESIIPKLNDNGIDHIWTNSAKDTTFWVERSPAIKKFATEEAKEAYQQERKETQARPEFEKKRTRKLKTAGVSEAKAQGLKRGEKADRQSAAEAELDQILKSISGTPLPKGQRADIMGELTRQLGRGVLAQQKRGVFEVVSLERAAQALATMSGLKKSVKKPDYITEEIAVGSVTANRLLDKLNELGGTGYFIPEDAYEELEYLAEGNLEDFYYLNEALQEITGDYAEVTDYVDEVFEEFSDSDKDPSDFYEEFKGQQGESVPSEYIDRAISRFGLTSMPNLAGYMLPDGRMLDFSEGQGERVADHREVESIIRSPKNEGASRYGAIEEFGFETGAVRMDVSNDTMALDFLVPPTDRQVEVLLDALGARDIVVDYIDKNGRQRSVDGDAQDAKRILNDVKNDAGEVEVKYSKDGQRIEALYFPKTGKVWLVEGNIEKGEAVGVFAHDLGVHALQLGFKETEAFERILKRVDSLAEKGNDPEVNAARKRAIDAKTPANQLAEETLGYLMNNAKQHHLIRRLWAALKRFLSQKTNWSWASIENFTPADMQAMAQSAIRANVSPVARTVSSATAGVNEFAQSVKMSTAKAANKIKGMANFKKWFGDSKVVDENGEPLVVYHGTAGELKNNSFDPKRIGDIFNNDEYGFFFTNNTRHSPFEDAQSAGAYAQNAAYETDKAPNIIPAYISLQNPLIIDSAEKNFGGRISVDYLENVYGKNRLFNNIRNNGHDGALIIDRDSKGNDGNPETIVVAMRPTQIKSIFNTGEWSPTDPDIMKSYAKEQAETADEIIFKAAYDASGEGEYRPYLDILANSGLSDKEFGDILENLLVSGKVSLSDDALSLRWNVQESTNPPVKPVDPADEVPRVSLENMSEIIGVDKAVLKKEFDKVKNDRAEEIGKAPNGKKSNLGDNLWVMVRTPRFKKWFGDWEKAPENSSKVVDENGEPKFNTHFDKGVSTVLRSFEQVKDAWKAGTDHGKLKDGGLIGIWFYDGYMEGDQPGYGDVKIDGFLDIKNPMPKLVSRDEFAQVVKDQGYFSEHLVKKYEFSSGKRINRKDISSENINLIFNEILSKKAHASKRLKWNDLIDGYTYGTMWNEDNDQKAISQRFQITETVMNMGYDGYYAHDRSWVVFDPKQVKSIKNVGSFSQSHPDIMFSMSAPAQEARRNTENLNATKDGQVSTTSAEAGEKAIQGIMQTLRKVAQKTEAELDKSKAKEKKLLDQYRELSSSLEAVPIEESVNLLNGLVRQSDIPDGSKKRIGQLIKSITAAKRPETQRKRLSNALETLRSDISKRLRAQIRAQVKRAAGPKREGVIKRGRYWHEQEKDITAIREIVHNMSPEQATETIARVENRLDGLHERLKKAAPENAETIRNQITDAELRLHHLRTFGGLKSKSLEGLLDAKYQIEELRRLGRSTLRAVKEAWQQEIDRKTNWLAQEITGQDDPRPETITQYNRRKQKEKSLVGKAKGAYQAVENSIQSFEHLLDRITIKSGKKIFQSRAVKELGSISHFATHEVNRLNRESIERTQSKGLEIFGVKKGRTLVKRLQKLSKKTGKIQVAGDTLQLSPMEAAYFYNVRKDQGSEKLFRKMGFTPETWSGIDSLMTKELRAWADYLHDDLLADALQGETEAYRAVNGVDRVPVGLFRDDQTDIPVINLNSAIMNRIFDANHYRAWAVPSKTFNDLFSVPETRGYIEQYAGTSTLKALDKFLEDFAKTPRELRGDMAWMDKLRSNVVLSMIGANPTTFFKQLTSIPAYAADIPTHAFVKNFAHGLANFGAVRRMIKDSQMAQERFGSGYDRDIHEASKATAEQVIGGKITNMRDLLMAMTKLGDMAAVYAGYTVYKHYYDKNKSKGHTKAHRIGIEEFERATERTQQAAGVKDRGSFERGSSLQKLLTMYMTSPAAYTRQTMAALRHFKTDPVGSSKRLLLFNVLLPMAFQAVASGFVGASGEDDEQWEEFWAKELRAVALGPFLGLPIARDIAAGLWDSAMGEWYGSDVQHSPVTETTKSLTQAVFHASKGLREFDDEAIEKAKGELLDFLGYAAGLPIKPGRRMKEGINDFLSGDTEHPWLAISGYSRAARDERYLGD